MAFLDERVHGRIAFAEPENLTLDELATRFFDDLKPGRPDGLAPKTWATYKSVYNSHVAPHAGDSPARAFENADAPDEWRDLVLHAGIGDQAFIKAKTCLSSILSYGVKQKVLSDNGVRRMPQRTRRRSSRAKTVTVMRSKDALSPDEVAVVVRHFEDRGRAADALAVEVAFLLGSRPEEWWALRFIHVNGQKAIVDEVISDNRIESPKTRDVFVPIPTFLRSKLAAYRKGEGAALDRHVFPGVAPEGHVTDSQMRNWRARIFKPACEDVLGRKIDGPYALRRGHISVRLARGEAAAHVASELGTSPKMIHDHYEKVIAHADNSRPPLPEQYFVARTRLGDAGAGFEQ